MSRTASPEVPRRAGRPNTAVLTRDRIVAAAVELIDEVGTEFSLATLAARLSVRPSSFYNHVSGKDDILAGVQDQITSAIDASMFEVLPWRAAVSAWARSYRQAFIAHPNAITLFALAPVSGTGATLRMYEQVTAGFERAGWRQHEIVPAIVAIESFVLGSALDAMAPATQLAPGEDAARVPRFAAAVAARDASAARTGASVAELAFEAGLDAIVHGLARNLP